MAGLDALRLKKATATLRQIEQEIKVKQKWMTTLMSFKGSFLDPADLLDICNKITKEAITFEHMVAGLAVEARSLSRSISSMPPKQLTLNKYTPSSGGELKDLAAITGRMPKELAELRTSIGKFRDFATRKMNDPTRTSDGQPMDVMGMLLALLDLFIKARKIQ